MRDWRTITPLEPGPDSDPFWFMTFEEFERALGQLIREGFVLPYGIFPASHVGEPPESAGIVEAICTSWGRWRTYEWNPPEFIPVGHERLQQFGDTDPTASPKPTWWDIRDALARADLRFVRQDRRDAALLQEAERICAAYIADQDVPQTLEQETLYRLRAIEEGADLAAKHAERNRLHAKATALLAWIDDHDRTQTELEELDPSADSHWSNGDGP